MESMDMPQGYDFDDMPTAHDESIGFLQGRPRRDTDISADDITNLVIELHTTHSVLEFLEGV